VPHRSRRGAASLLEIVVPHRSPLVAANLLKTAHRSRLAAARLQAVAHRSLLETGSLLVASLLPPESTWVAPSKLRPCELVLRLQTLQPVEVEGQVVEAEPRRSGLVVRSADAGVVNWKK
jgi:hypothetical protein